MTDTTPTYDIDKRTLRNVIYALFEGKKRAELESFGIKISTKEITRFSPTQLPQILQEIYYKMTGRTITKVVKQSYLESEKCGGQKDHQFTRIPDKESYKHFIPKNCLPVCVFDAVCIISVDKDHEHHTEILKKHFNISNLTKNKNKDKTK